MICVVVPTIRPEQMATFLAEWEYLLSTHDATLLTVWDGDKPYVATKGKKYSIDDIMGNNRDLIYNKNDGVRNLGFAAVAKYYPRAEYVITLDDDVLAFGDTLADHINALNMRVPISWMSTLIDDYPRGVPYNIRSEAPVMLSHGVWGGVKDWDAPTQLVRGNPHADFYKGAIPRGVLYPMCGMNLAFRREMLPYMYFAPMGYRVGLDRFADIWLGIESKKILDAKGWAVVTGYAKVYHQRASNVWTNLKKEAPGLELNEDYGQDPYFTEYAEQRERWGDFICEYL